MLHPITSYALSEEMRELAKEAAGRLPSWALPAGIGAAGVAGTGIAASLGHKKGKATGKKEGLKTGLTVGGKAGYRAGIRKGHSAHSKHRAILASLSELTKRHPGGVTLKRGEGGRIGYYLPPSSGKKKKTASALPIDLFLSLLTKEANFRLAKAIAQTARKSGKTTINTMGRGTNKQIVNATKRSLKSQPMRGPRSIDPTGASGGAVDVRPIVGL